MPWGLLFFLVLAASLWHQLPTNGKTFGEVWAAFMELSANDVAEAFKTAALIVGMAFAVFFIGGKSWLVNKTDRIVHGVSGTRDNTAEIAKKLPGKHT
jgi:hypothetical protein